MPFSRDSVRLKADPLDKVTTLSPDLRKEYPEQLGLPPFEVMYGRPFLPRHLSHDLETNQLVTYVTHLAKFHKVLSELTQGGIEMRGTESPPPILSWGCSSCQTIKETPSLSANKGVPDLSFYPPLWSLRWLVWPPGPITPGWRVVLHSLHLRRRQQAYLQSMLL